MATSQEAIDAFNAAGGNGQDTQNDAISNPIEVDVMALQELFEIQSLLAKDNDTLENDSAFGGPAASNTSKTSLTSGITRYREENGRRYHAYRDGKYLMPNDDDEQDRMDLLHHVFNLVLDGKLYLAPIENPQRVLDVGTGTGIWAIDFADQYPSSHVVGCDLSPIQPGWIPPNLEFEIDDVEDTWRYSQKFDFIHIRSLGGSIASWPHLLDQARDNLNEGGYIELVDFEYHGYSDDGTGELAPSFQKWQAGLDEASKLFGRDLNVAMKFKDWLEEAGFEAVVERHWRLPMAPWARDRRNKEIGLYLQQNMLDATVAYGMAHFTRILGWSPEEYQVLAAGVRNEFKDPRVHNWCNMYIVYGRKPISSGEETISPALGAPVLSTGADLISGNETRYAGRGKNKDKEVESANVGEEKVSGKATEQERRDESDIAAAVKEAADNVMAQGKGKSKVLEVVGEGGALGIAPGKGKSVK
ncbi:methyltransferase domain-containing protein [Botrytis cinerea]